MHGPKRVNLVNLPPVWLYATHLTHIEREVTVTVSLQNAEYNDTGIVVPKQLNPNAVINAAYN